MEASNDKLRKTFSNVIEDYDYARPKYPKEIYDKIVKFSELKQRDKILEVGAGTGQATDLFLHENYNMDLIEVSDEQAKFLKNKYDDYNNIHVFQEYFENYKPSNEYNLIFSATAFHWIDETIGYPTAWNMLKSGGTMAVFWQMYSVTLVNDDIHSGLYDIRQKYMPDKAVGYDEEGLEKIKDKRIRQFQSGGYFHSPQYYEYKWKESYDSDRYASLVNTYSSTQLLDKSNRLEYISEIKEYIDKNGGVIEVPEKVCLYLDKKL